MSDTMSSMPGHGGHHDHEHGAVTAPPGNAAHQGHDKHAGHDPEMFRRKFWLSLALTVHRLALERMRGVDAVLFDKTGTLTRGAHVVTG